MTTTQAPQTAIGYLRANVQIPGENFVQQYSKLTQDDKNQLLEWAKAEMALLGIPIK